MADEIDTLTLSINKLNELLKKMVDLTTKQVQIEQEPFNQTMTNIEPIITGIGDKLVKVLRDKYNEIKDAINQATKYGVTKAIVSGGAKIPRRAGQAISGGLGKTISATASPFTSVSKILGPLTGAIGGVLGTISESFGLIASLVSKINPALVQQFEMAFEDLQAVLGDALQPVLKVGIELVRQFADVLETMRPAIDPLITILSSLIKKYAELFTSFAGFLVPILGVLADVMKTLLPVFTAIIDGFKLMYQAMRWTVNAIIDLVNFMLRQVNHLLPGSGLGQFTNLKYSDLKQASTFGKALRGVEYSSGEDIGAETRKAAFAQGVNWQEQTVDELKQIKDLQKEQLKIITAQQETQKEQARIQEAVKQTSISGLAAALSS